MTMGRHAIDRASVSRDDGGLGANPAADYYCIGGLPAPPRVPLRKPATSEKHEQPAKRSQQQPAASGQGWRRDCYGVPCRAPSMHGDRLSIVGVCDPRDCRLCFAAFLVRPWVATGQARCRGWRRGLGQVWSGAGPRRGKAPMGKSIKTGAWEKKEWEAGRLGPVPGMDGVCSGGASCRWTVDSRRRANLEGFVARMADADGPRIANCRPEKAGTSGSPR